MAFWRGLTRPARYAALFTGAVPVLAFPALDLEWVAWFALVPGLLLLRAAPSGREAAVRGWWFGTGYLLADLYWLAPNLGPGLLLVMIVLGLPWAGVGYGAWRLLRGPEPEAAEPASRWRLPGPPPPALRQALAAMVVLPSCWVVIDWIRSWQAIGGPWAIFAASQWQHPVVLSLAAVGGMWLVSFVLVAANTAITIIVTTIGSRPPRGSATARFPRGACAAGVAGALIALGAAPLAFALTASEYAVPPTARLSLTLVQPGLEVGGPGAELTREIRLTTASLAAHSSDLVVWGESSVGYDLATSPRVMSRLRALSAATSTPLLVSQDAINPAGAKTKVAVLIGPGGIEGTYTKTRLVPFGEYIPFRSLLGWLTRISRAAPENMATGKGARVLHTALADGHSLAFGVLICFESSFPDMSRVDTDHGAQVLIYQTSDSTFQGSWAPEQHASLAALRAAETGRLPAVQAALTGDTAAFDARGRQLAWADTQFQGVVRVTVALPPTSVRTPFDRYGDYVPWLSIAVTAIALAIAIGLSVGPDRHPDPGDAPESPAARLPAARD